MLAFFPRPSRSPRDCATRGFTLLEILVVLGLVGLLVAVSLPQFYTIHDRLTFNLNRETFEKELSGLSYAAFKDGRPLILSGTYPRKASEKTAADVRITEIEIEEPVMLEPGQLRPIQPADAGEAKLNLPENWQVSVESPIVFQASGFCGGGVVALTVGAQRYDYQLKAPTCVAVLRE